MGFAVTELAADHSGRRVAFEAIPERSRNCHRVEGGADDLRRAHTFRVTVSFAFEQLRMREDDAELIIEAVKKYSKIARIRGVRAIFSH